MCMYIHVCRFNVPTAPYDGYEYLSTLRNYFPAITLQLGTAFCSHQSEADIVNRVPPLLRTQPSVTEPIGACVLCAYSVCVCVCGYVWL